MRSRHLLVLALVGGVAVACDRNDADVEETEALPGAEPAPVPAEPMGNMVVASGDFEKTDIAGDRDISGTAELRHSGTMADSPLELHVRLQGLTAEHAWHIHAGPCSNANAPVAVPFTDALSSGPDGIAERTVPVGNDQLTQQQLESGEYSVRVHEGGTDQPGQPIVCADLNRS